jgi:hypothetical protein
MLHSRIYIASRLAEHPFLARAPALTEVGQIPIAHGHVLQMVAFGEAVEIRN